MPIHSKKIFAIINGFNITNFLNKISMSGEGKTSDTSVFGTEDEQFIAGLRGSTFSADGFYDGNPDAVDEVLSKIIDTNRNSNVITWLPYGNTLGSSGFTIEGMATQYKVGGTIDDATKITISAISSIGRKKVIVLKELGIVSGVGVTDIVDSLREHIAGGSLYLHLSSNTGSLDLSIEHSLDGVIWATLNTISTISDSNKQALVYTLPQIVHRYLRLVYNVSVNSSSSFLSVVNFNA
jgi:hypothetical protein